MSQRCGLKPRSPNPKSMAAPVSWVTSPRRNAEQDPPGRSLRSSTMTATPRLASRAAALNPDSPAPATMTDSMDMPGL